MAFRFILLVSMVLLLLAVCVSNAFKIDANYNKAHNISCHKGTMNYKNHMALRGITQSNDQSAPKVDDATEATSAVTTAQGKVNTALSEIKTLFDAAKAANDAAEKAKNEEASKAEAAKTEVEKEENAISEAADYVKSTKEAADNAKTHLDTATSKATEAHNAADTAQKAAQKAQSDLKEAETESDNAEKKKKADKAGADADKAKEDAKKATSPTEASTTALNSCKDELKKAEIGMNRVKTIVAADKAKKAMVSSTNHISDATTAKEKTTKYQSDVTTLLAGVSEELQKKVETQKNLINQAVQTATTESQNVDNSVKSVNEQKGLTDSAVTAVKAADTVEKALSEYNKAKSAADTSQSKAQEANEALKKVNNAATHGERAMHIIVAIVAAAKVDTALHNIAEHLKEINSKATEAGDSVDAITKLQTELLGELKIVLTEKLKTATDTRDAMTLAVVEVTKHQTNTTEMKNNADAAAAAASSAGDAAAAATQATKAKEYAEKCSAAETASNNILQTVLSNAKNAMHAKYAAEALVVSSKVDAAIAKTSAYEVAAKKNQTVAENTFEEMKKAVADCVSEKKESMAKLLQEANESLQIVIGEAKAVASAKSKAEEQKKEAESAVSSLEKAVSNLEEAKSSAGKAAAAAIAANQHETTAKTAFDKVISAAEKIEGANHHVKVILIVEKVTVLSSTAAHDHANALEKSNTISLILKEIDAMVSKCVEEDKHNLQKIVDTCSNTQREAQNEVNKAVSALTEANQKKIEANAALEGLKKDGISLSGIVKKLLIAENCVQNAKVEAEKARSAFTILQTKAEEIEKAKYEAAAVIAMLKTVNYMKEASSYATEATHKKNEANHTFTAIKSVQATASSSKSSSISENVNTAKVALDAIQRKEEEALIAARDAKSQNDKVEKIFESIRKTETTVSLAKDLSAQATLAEATAAEHAGKARNTLQDIVTENSKISAAKTKLDTLIRKYATEQTKSELPLQALSNSSGKESVSIDSSSEIGTKDKGQHSEKITDGSKSDKEIGVNGGKSESTVSEKSEGVDGESNENEKKSSAEESAHSESETVHSKEQTNGGKPSDSSASWNHHHEVIAHGLFLFTLICFYQ